MGLFESVGLMHYSCYCGPFETEYLSLLTMQLLLGALVKQSSLLTHAHCSCSCRPLWRQSTELWCGSENIIWAYDKFFTKNEEYLRAKYFVGPRQVSRLPFLKHITVYNPNNDLIWEYETDGTRSASSDMRISHLMCACKHCNVKISLYLLDTLKLLMNLSLQKHRFNVIFHN